MLAAALMVGLLAYVVFSVWTAPPPPPLQCRFPRRTDKTKPDRCHLMRRTACRKPLSNAQGAAQLRLPGHLRGAAGRPLGSGKVPAEAQCEFVARRPQRWRWRS